jgi:hypothetical protein
MYKTQENAKKIQDLVAVLQSNFNDKTALHDQSAHRQVHRIHIQIEGIRPHTNTGK